MTRSLPEAMTGKPTWEDCATAGMSKSEAARARGVCVQAAQDYARRTGLRFVDGRSTQVYKDRRSAIQKARKADPALNPLVLLTPEERADYDLMKRKGFTRAEALTSIGRTDLVQP